MAAISGLNGQIDINSFVENFLQVERRPVERLENRKSDILNKSSVFSGLKTELSTLCDRVKGFRSFSADSNLSARAVISSNDSIVTAEAEANTDIGVNTLFVSRIASRDTALSDIVKADSNSLAKKFDGSTKQFSIQIGDDPAVEFTVSFNDKNETNEEVLTRIAESINNAGIGVTANSISVNRNSLRLSIVSKETGSSNTISLNDTSGKGLLDNIGLNLGSQRTEATNKKSGYIQENSEELDALFTLNGVEITHDSNTVSGVVKGLTLSLLKAQDEGENAETLTVSTDGDALQEEIKSFVDEYNTALSFINKRLQRDPSSNVRGKFVGNSTIIQLRIRLREQISGNITGNGNTTITNITNLGIEIERDGTLTIADQEKFEQSIEENANEIRNFFRDDGGLAQKLDDELKKFTSFSGVFRGIEKSFRENIKTIDRHVERLNTRLKGRESNLRQQFTQLSRLLSTLQSQQLTLQRSGFQFGNLATGGLNTPQFNTF